MNYTAVRGDSLWGIYKRNKAKGNTHSWGDYKAANPNFKDGQTMHPGDSITIPEKIIPDEIETETEEPIKKKDSVEEAKEAVDETPNEPENHIDKADCCCMVAPWTIKEEGRDYTLYVTKEAEEKLIDKTIKVSKKEISNVKTYRETLKDFIMNSAPPTMTYEEVKRYLSATGYELQIVSPEKGKSKKIIIEHKFLKKKCEKSMILESVQGQMVLKENDTIEIDSLGKIKGKFLPNTSSQQNKYIDVDKLSDWEIILGALFSPKKIVNKVKIYPIGKTCNHQPTANLFIFPSMKIDGALTLKYKPDFKSKKYITDEFDKAKRDTHGNPKIKKGRFTQRTQEVTVDGGIHGYFGDKTISYAYEKVFGGTEIERKKRKNTLTPRGFFNKIDKVFDVFIRANNAGGRFLNIEIGDIGFSLSIKDYKFIENVNEYNADYAVNFVLVIMLFNNTKVKVDIVELILLYVARSSYVYKILSDGRHDIKEGKSWDIGIKVGGKAEIIIELGFFGGSIVFFKASKNIGEPLKLEQAKISPRVGLIAKAFVKIELQIHVFELGGELGATGASVDKATLPSQFIWNIGVDFDKEGSHFTSKTSFTGLALYGMYKIYVKIKESESSGFFSSVFGKSTPSREKHMEPIILAPKWGDADAVAVGAEN